MGEPLGSHIGNALEVKEAIDVLAGRVKGPLLAVSLELGGWMLVLGGAANDLDAAKAKLKQALSSGEGLKTLARMITAQGGDASCCQDTGRLPQARVIMDVPALGSGYVRDIDAAQLGNTAQDMGAGRKKKTDAIDYSVGFVLHRRIGDAVAEGDTIATVHARNEEDARVVASRIQDAISIFMKVPPSKLVFAVVTGKGVQRV